MLDIIIHTHSSLKRLKNRTDLTKPPDSQTFSGIVLLAISCLFRGLLLWIKTVLRTATSDSVKALKTVAAPPKTEH
jgi:hypothetical protein